MNYLPKNWVKLLILVACSVAGCASVPHVRSNPLIFPYLKSSINERRQFYDSHMIVVNKAAGIFTVDGQGKPLKEMQTYLENEVPEYAYDNIFERSKADAVGTVFTSDLLGTLFFFESCLSLAEGDQKHAILGVNLGLLLFGGSTWYYVAYRIKGPDYQAIANYFNNWLRKQLDLLPWGGNT